MVFASFFDASKANLQEVRGISEFNLKLLEQHGAAQTSFKDDEKKDDKAFNNFSRIDKIE